MNKTNTTNIVSSEEAINIIETSVKTLISNPERAFDLSPILLRGAPGVGKSTIVKEIAKKLGVGFIDVRLAQMDRCDFSGLPSVENGTTNWNIPSFWPRDPESKGILFFDEITSAPSDVQVAAYSVVLDRAVPNSGYTLPNGWYIVAAGNRKEDKAVAKTLSSALANRFMHFDVEANVEDWSNWAVRHDMHPSVTGYIRYRPVNLIKTEGQDLERGWPSPRAWERVSQVIPMFNSNEEVLRKTVYGLIGPSVGVEFMEFHRLHKRFDDVLEMLTDPKKEIIIPKESSEKYALCSAVAYLVWNGKDEADTKNRIAGMYRILMKLTADFATMTVRVIMQGNSKVSRMQASLAIVKADGYKAFAEKFGAAMSKDYSLAA